MDFERVHTYFEQVLHTETIAGPRTRLIVFNGGPEFASYAQAASVRGFYQSSPDGDFIVLPSLKGDVMPVAAHEYAHLFFRRTGRRYPLWLSDGLAEYFSTVTPQRDGLRIGAPPPERARALGFGVRLMPLERLFAVTRDSIEYTAPKSASLFYAQSWALAHLLVTDPRYRDLAPAFFARLARDEPAGLAFTTVYRANIDELGRDLTRYTLRGNYRTTTMQVDALPAILSATPRASTSFEAGVVLASLLGANPARESQAQAAFDALEQENRVDVQLLEAIALFDVRRQNLTAARPYLDRAIAAHSQLGRIFVYAAESRRLSASATGDPDPDDERLLATALALAPDDVEVHLVAAQRRITERRPADALALLAPFTRVPVEYEKLVDDTRALAQRLIKTPR